MALRSKDKTIFGTTKEETWNTLAYTPRLRHETYTEVRKQTS
jgi:hypothetical protein